MKSGMGETRKKASEKVLLVWGCTFYVHIQFFVHHLVYKEFIFWLKYLYFNVLYCKKEVICLNFY